VAGVDPTVASLTQALLYGLSTRLGKPGREPYMLALALIIGLAGGWLTVATGGIAAAFLGHAVTRFAVFLCTGHAGQVALRGGEEEDIERRRRPPEGWRVIGSR
jgi:membrane protease YdiL (CAAX protease family)